MLFTSLELVSVIVIPDISQCLTNLSTLHRCYAFPVIMV